MQETFGVKSSYNMVQGIMVFPGKADGVYPCVILSHGLISSKESTKYVALSERFAEQGIASCRFDYHGCGESEGNIAETTLSIRLDNLNTIVDYVSRRTGIDPSRLGIVGSSFGGTTALLQTARDRRIRCTSLWATPWRLEKEGDGSIDNIVFKDSIYTDFAQYDILGEAAGVARTLVVHGSMDETVPCTEGKAIFEALKEPKDLQIIEGADHVFSDPPHRERVISLAMDWFGKYL